MKIKDLEEISIKRLLESGCQVRLVGKKLHQQTMKGTPQEKELWKIDVVVEDNKHKVVREKEFGYLDTAIDYFEKIFI